MKEREFDNLFEKQKLIHKRRVDNDRQIKI